MVGSTIVTIVTPCRCAPNTEVPACTGLWPQDFSGNFPCFCLPERFNQSAVQPLLPALEQFWSAGPELWAHEWEKHGTCIVADKHSPFSTQRQFFNTTLNLRQRHAVVPALAAAGIHPSNSTRVPVAKLKTAWKAFFGGFPELPCDADMKLSGWVFCLDKQLQPIDCPLHNLDTCQGNIVWPSV